MSAVGSEETQQVLVAPGVRPPLAVPRRLLRMRSDAALAERFAAGDEAAFDVIYERHRPVVLAVCMGVLGTPPDAEDATQETFSALAVALRTRPPADLRPWLIRVARNASIDTTRRRRHRLLTLDGEIPEVAARPTGSGQAELAVVLDGIRELPEGQRMALLMRELGGHSYSEIAEFLATDEEAVKGLIARARVGLRTYREATELSCASARSTIAAEPDGRRYDKTIRRHLRGCSSCRSYRAALRDDAKALRAALPIQAGSVATGNLTGLLTAAKGSLLGYGLTQAATTCAASACAVGAIGGMVFVAPVHTLGLPTILPAVTTPAAHTHKPATRPVIHHVATVAPSAAAVTTPAVNEAAGRSSSADVSRPVTTHSAHRRHHHRLRVTRITLPPLPHHGSASASGTSGSAPAATGNTAPTTQTAQTAPASNPTPPASVPAPAQPTPAASAPGSQGAGWQNGHGDHGHGHGPLGAVANASTSPTGDGSGAGTPSAPGASPTGPVPVAPTTTAPSPVVQAGPGHGRGWGAGGSGHGGWRHGTVTQTITTATAATTTATATAPVTTTPPTQQGAPGWGSQGGGWGQQGGGWGQQQASGAPGTPTQSSSSSQWGGWGS